MQAVKYPRDWILSDFRKTGEDSRHLDQQLEREDQRADRMRLIVVVGVITQPTSYRASLMLADVRIRGIDYHGKARRRFYREVIPSGWHEDLVDPNVEYSRSNPHPRILLDGLDPSEPFQFLVWACKHWNIKLPPTEDMLL